MTCETPLFQQSAPIPKRKRGKGESSIIKDAASEADVMKWDVEVEEGSTKKKQSSDTQYESPMFVMTPAMARMTKEYADTMIAEKKQKKTVVPDPVPVTDPEQTVTVTASELNQQPEQSHQPSPK